MFEWGETISYAGAHWRIRKTKGSASEHACIECGRTAEQWAYDGLDPDEHSGPAGPGSEWTCRYSGKPEHYAPMCRSCHKAFDNEQRQSQSA